jgi:hypothetical protein
MPTTPYQDLCRTFTETRGEWSAYRDDCLRIAEQVVRGFVAFLKVPDGLWRVLPPDVTPETFGLPWDFPHSLKLGDDGVWHLTLQITLQSADKSAQQPLLLPIKVAKTEAEKREYQVCIADKTCHQLHGGLPTEMQSLFADAFKLIESELDHQLDDFLDQSPTLAPKKIGFI